MCQKPSTTRASRRTSPWPGGSNGRGFPLAAAPAPCPYVSREVGTAPTHTRNIEPVAREPRLETQVTSRWIRVFYETITTKPAAHPVRMPSPQFVCNPRQ